MTELFSARLTKTTIGPQKLKNIEHCSAPNASSITLYLMSIYTAPLAIRCSWKTYGVFRNNLRN
jgi:hypothetical protein